MTEIESYRYFDQWSETRNIFTWIVFISCWELFRNYSEQIIQFRLMPEMDKHQMNKQKTFPTNPGGLSKKTI